MECNLYVRWGAVGSTRAVRAMKAVAPWRRRHVLPTVAVKPERGEGVVLHYRAAG